MLAIGRRVIGGRSEAACAIWILRPSCPKYVCCSTRRWLFAVSAELGRLRHPPSGTALCQPALPPMNCSSKYGSAPARRSQDQTSELQSQIRTASADFFIEKKP